MVILTFDPELNAEFGEEVSVTYSVRVLATDALVLEDETRRFRIGDGEVMPGTLTGTVNWL